MPRAPPDGTPGCGCWWCSSRCSRRARTQGRWRPPPSPPPSIKRATGSTTHPPRLPEARVLRDSAPSRHRDRVRAPAPGRAAPATSLPPTRARVAPPPSAPCAPWSCAADRPGSPGNVRSAGTCEGHSHGHRPVRGPARPAPRRSRTQHEVATRTRTRTRTRGRGWAPAVGPSRKGQRVALPAAAPETGGRAGLPGVRAYERTDFQRKGTSPTSPGRLGAAAPDRPGYPRDWGRIRLFVGAHLGVPGCAEAIPSAPGAMHLGALQL